MADLPPSPLNYEPIFQKFVIANKRFADCLSAVPKDDIAAMSDAQLDSFCQSEKSEIKSILNGNRMTMTQLVTDRINVLYAIRSVGIKKKNVTKYID